MMRTMMQSDLEAPFVPLSHIQIDAHTFKSASSVDLEVDGILESLRAMRTSLLTAICPDTECVIATHRCLNEQPNQQDVLHLFEKLTIPWEPMELTMPKLHYMPGAMMATALPEYPHNAAFGFIHADNAKSHSAEAVLNYVCSGRSGTMALSIPNQPEFRDRVEFSFNRLAKDVSAFKSFSGTGPQDPQRESHKNALKPPLLRFNWVDELIDVLVSNYNSLPIPRLLGDTPLSAFQRGLKNSLIPITFGNQHLANKPFISTTTARVIHEHQYRKFPHLYFARLKYTGPEFVDPELKNQLVQIQFDRRDIRTIKAYTLDGRTLGTLSAPKSWQRWPVSLYTVKTVKRWAEQTKIKSIDPLADYFDFIASNRHVPKYITEIVRLNRESSGRFSLDVDVSDISEDLIDSAETVPHEKFEWSEAMIRDQREVDDEE